MYLLFHFRVYPCFHKCQYFNHFYGYTFYLTYIYKQHSIAHMFSLRTYLPVSALIWKHHAWEHLLFDNTTFWQFLCSCCENHIHCHYIYIVHLFSFSLSLNTIWLTSHRDMRIIPIIIFLSFSRNLFKPSKVPCCSLHQQGGLVCGMCKSAMLWHFSS